jgi:hypothetical protein
MKLPGSIRDDFAEQVYSELDQTHLNEMEKAHPLLYYIVSSVDGS